MDWRAIRFDWVKVRAFLVTAEEGSLSAAARALGMAQPTLGRQVAGLEAELGVALFERSGRGLALTPVGLELLEHARAMGEAAGRLSLAAAGQAQAIEGSVVITASEIYAAYLLPPILARLRDEAPGIEVELVASNDLRDLRRREADIAIRNARPEQPDLIARQVAGDSAGLFASRAYLRRHGPLAAPADLEQADFIGFDNVEQLLGGLQGLGLPVARRNFRLLSGNHLVQWEMARQGLGIAVVPLWLGETTRGMRRVLPEMAPIRYPVWLVAHRELRMSRRIRLVYDLLAEELARLGGSDSSA